MIQINDNPAETASIIAVCLGFLTIGLVLALRPRIGVRMVAKWAQWYKRTYNVSWEQMEGMPIVFPRSIVGGSITEFVQNGNHQPELFPNAIALVRVAGVVMAGFILLPSCLIFLLILVFGTT